MLFDIMEPKDTETVEYFFKLCLHHCYHGPARWLDSIYIRSILQEQPRAAFFATSHHDSRDNWSLNKKRPIVIHGKVLLTKAEPR